MQQPLAALTGRRRHQSSGPLVKQTESHRATRSAPGLKGKRLVDRHSLGTSVEVCLSATPRAPWPWALLKEATASLALLCGYFRWFEG